MTYISKTSPQEFPSSEPILPDGLLRGFRAIAEILREAFALSRACNRMLQRRRGRQALRELDDHLLRDIGLTREQVEREALKRF
jgi:uncharacterized protein YjiS (DUF1127 family)